MLLALPIPIQSFLSSTRLCKFQSPSSHECGAIPDGMSDAMLVLKSRYLDSEKPRARDVERTCLNQKFETRCRTSNWAADRETTKVNSLKLCSVPALVSQAHRE